MYLHIFFDGVSGFIDGAVYSWHKAITASTCRAVAAADITAISGSKAFHTPLLQTAVKQLPFYTSYYFTFYLLTYCSR